MKIALDIEEGDIERIVTSLDNQHAYTRSRNLEDSGYKRLEDLFRGFLKLRHSKEVSGEWISY